MPIFGYDTIGSTSQAIGNFNYATLFTCPDNGTVTSISVAVSPSATTNKLKVAIYDSSKNLISSGELNPIGSTTKQFYTVNVTQVSLTKNADYYLAAACADLNGNTDGTILTWRDGVAETWIYSAMGTDVPYASLWEDPWTNDGGGTGRKFSFYATYETTTSSSTSTSTSTSSSTTSTSSSTTSTSSSTTSTSSSTTSTSSSTTSTSSSTSTTTTTSTSTTVPYLKFTVKNHDEFPINTKSEVLQLDVKLVK